NYICTGRGIPGCKESSMNISKRSLNSCVLALILLLGVGCARKLDDAKMSSEIQSKFSQDSGLASKQLTVQANNGVVTLSGTVENAAQRDAAGQQAAGISGVKTVINNLQIGNAVADANPSAKPAPIIAAHPAEEKPERVAKAPKGRAPKHAPHTSRSSEQDSAKESYQQTATSTPAPSAQMTSTPLTL